MSLLNLPDEIKILLGQYLERTDDAKALRLTCRNFCNVLTPILFARLILRPNKENEKVLGLFDSDKKSFVKSVVIVTSPNPDFSLRGAPHVEEDELAPLEYEDMPEHFRSSISRLDELPHVDNLEVRHTEECALDRDDSLLSREIPEIIDYRADLWRATLSGLKLDATHKSLVRTLTIRNLQNAEHESVTDGDEFAKLMAHLSGLHLSVCSERDDAAPESDIEFPEMHSCFPWMRQSVFEPALQNLTHLTLWFDTEWGFIPKFAFEGLLFPHLRSLALLWFTIANSKQIEWILSHGSTLRALYLEDCPIIHNMKILREGGNVKLDYDGSELEQIPQPEDDDDDWCDFFAFPKRWHECFDAMRHHLTHLTTFCFAASSIGEEHYHAFEEHDFERRYCLGSELYRDRYIVYDDGIAPTHFLRYGNEGEPNDIGVFSYPDEETQSEDQRAFGDLIEAVRTRAAQKVAKS